MKKSDFLDMVKDTEKNQLGLDFDGVIYKNSKGFHDGTMYDEPLDGAIESIKHLNEILGYDLVIYTCKANPERPLVNDKTGIELVWEWLEKYGVKNNIKDVTYIKPNAVAYIDDKGITFDNWSDCIRQIERI
tara:strand:- start:1435 stop:1830 length:396 start_codon:yes stop_codon:yes gene_type:complete